MLAHKLCGGAGEERLYVDDVFSTYLYTGNGSTQTINNGIDLAGKGGLVWIKSRSHVTDNALFDTARGGANRLVSNNNSAQNNSANYITSFNANGFTTGSGGVSLNYSEYNYVSWTFRKAPKFFDVVTYTGDGNSARRIAHSLGVEPGLIFIKRTNGTQSWIVGAKTGLSASGSWYGQLYLEQTASVAYPGYKFGDGTVSDFSVGGSFTNDTNYSGATYVAYLFAHDPSADGIIQCGSFTTDASGNATVNLGWEPQYLLTKTTGTVATGYDNWWMTDTMRGLATNGGDIRYLSPNNSNAENGGSGNILPSPTATGFSWKTSDSNWFNKTIIYLAIRRPNKPPTSGTQVYNAIHDPGDGTSRKLSSPFNVDVWLSKRRSQLDNGSETGIYDRLRGPLRKLMTISTSSEISEPESLIGFDVQNGVRIGANTTSGFSLNYPNAFYVHYAFRRAPGFMDIVAYTGTGVARTVNHNLGAVPELMIVKGRSNSNFWYVYAGPLGATKRLLLDQTAGGAIDNAWNNAAPTASVFHLIGTNDGVNFLNYTYIAYLFASLPGVQYINSFVGDGTTGRVINCGFAAGARFICIKATSATGNWWIYDSARGILAANDPVLALNSTAAEVTSADAIDPHSSGFIVNQEATCSINASGVSYLVWAIA